MNQGKPRPKILGDFEILRELGRGGMGVVYEARQRSLNRRVALKVLSTGLGLSEKAITRFRREAEAAAKLHHTNIVPIYATGAEHGTHYYAMELIAGPSLDQVIRQMRAGKASIAAANPQVESAGDLEVTGPLPKWVGETIAFEGSPPPSARSDHNASQSAAKSNPGPSSSGNTKYFDNVAKMIADVADALHHAHEEGVIHRDIKPSNLLLSADGRLSLNDFGLARVLEQPGMTMSGEFVGSPLYMSPEQITAGRAPLDHRTDIYSLGATLYELLTLEPPFPGQQRDQVIAQILHKEPVPARRKNRKLPVDLETICMKALEKDPDHRYQMAGQMAEDLRHFVNRFAISARRVGLFGRAVKWVRRNRAVSALLLLLAIVVGLAGAMLYKSERDRRVQVEQQARERQEQIELIQDMMLAHLLSDELRDARDQRDRAKQLGASKEQLDLMEAQIALFDGDYDRVVEILDDPRLRGTTAAFAMSAVAKLYSGDEMDHFKMLPNVVKSPAESYQDSLLKGWAESLWLPHQAVRDLEVAMERRKSPIAKLLYGEALTERAVQTEDRHQSLKDIDLALEHIRTARSYLGEKPWPEAIYVYASIVEANLMAEFPDDRLRRLEMIRKDADRVAQWGEGSFQASWVTTQYLGQTGRTDELLASFGHRTERDVASQVYRVATLFRYRRDQGHETADAFAKMRPKFRKRVESMYAFVQMSEPGADHRAIAKAFKEKQAAYRGEDVDVYAYWDICALALLGETEEVRKLGRQYELSMSKLKSFTSWDQYGRFMSGDCNETTLLHDTRTNRYDTLHAHFLIAIRRLVDDDREGAKVHFRKVVETDCFGPYAYWWAQAFGQRLDDDPNWLPWLRKPRNGPLRSGAIDEERHR